MYIPTKRWQKLEKNIFRNMIKGEYRFGEDAWVSAVLKVSLLKVNYPWIEANKNPTCLFKKCWTSLASMDECSNSYCGCGAQTHEDLYITHHSKYTEISNEEPWDLI